MRASHSLKGAARIVGLDAIVHLTHAMEDRFVAAQAGSALVSADIDRMLAATDWLAKLQSLGEAEIGRWLEENAPGIEKCAAALLEANEAPAVGGGTAIAEAPPDSAEAATAALGRMKEASDPNEGDGHHHGAAFATQPPRSSRRNLHNVHLRAAPQGRARARTNCAPHFRPV